MPTILRSKLAGAARVCVLAVGSHLRADDGAGLLVATHLRGLLDSSEREWGLYPFSPSEKGDCTRLRPPIGDPENGYRPPANDAGGQSPFSQSPFSDPRDHEPAQITHHKRTTPARAVELTILLGETAPENFTGEIKRFAPSHLVLVDAADFGGAPGAIGLLDPYDADNASMSTHSLPIRVMTDYLRRFIDCRFLLAGIQPASREFGKDASPAIAAAAKLLAQALFDSF